MSRATLHQNLGKRREPIPVHTSLEKRLLSYAACASATGMSVLALGNAADAKIVYTPSDIRIKPDAGTVYLDLNHDGIKDFQFSAFYYHVTNPSNYYVAQLRAAPVHALNRIWAVESRNTLCAAALPRGRKVGNGGRFQPGHSLLFMAFANSLPGAFGTYFGPWLSSTKRGYLGLKFSIAGKVHFGWARIKRVSPARPGSFPFPGGFPAIITGYAYETIPGKAIITGATDGPGDNAQPAAASIKPPDLEPATLGMLALGAPGLSIWRREETAVTTP